MATLYIISLIPIVLYLALIKAFDDFALTQSKKIAIAMGWGVIACLGCFLFSRVMNQILESEGIRRFAIVEELVKALPLVFLIFRKKVAFFSEAAMYGSAIGAGFALLENILYVAISGNLTIGDALVRGFGTALLHIGCTALLCCGVIVITRLCFGKSKLVNLASAVLAFIPPILIHLGHNQFWLPEFLQMILVIVIILALEYLFYTIDIKLINKWLDSCINNDIELLKAINKGELRTTRAGEYLLDGKGRFQPEVFFDIICYLRLYLELSIEAKSLLIMKSAGLEMPLDEARHKENVGKIHEISNLGKSIGKSGIMYLSPLVNFKNVDHWAITELL